jgi:signal transduction histidine kinase
MYNPFGQLVKEKSYPVSATAPFHVKTGFYILIIILLFLFGTLFILFYLRSIRIKTATKSNIAMDLHDESGTILTRLLILSKKEKFEIKEKEMLQSGLKEALYSFRTYLDSISRKKHTWLDLTDELQEFIKTSCSEAEISVDFNIQYDKDYSLRGELFRDIKLTIYEIVTNTIKHAKADHISLSFNLKNKNLEIKIGDNGTCDINDLNAMKGNGIRNIKKRITRNNGKYLYYISEGMSGLTIEINLSV